MALAHTFDDLWTRLSNGDESVLIEAKKASSLGKSVFDTISAFSNEPDANGGYLLLGVAPKAGSLFPDYEIQGVSDPDKLQRDLASQCAENFSCTIRPQMSVEMKHGKNVVVAYIPEASPHDKPVYIKSKGPSNGTYRRIGSTDQICRDDDLSMFYQGRGQLSYDENTIDGTSFEDIDPRAVVAYRKARTENEDGDNLELLRYPDNELLYALNAMDKGAQLTLSGLVLFGKSTALRRHLPMTRIDYIRVEGREWVPNPEKRYQTIERLGPLLLTIPQLISQILDDIPKAFSLPESEVHRRDVPLIPRTVIREAVVNSLMHRSYRNSQPVQIIRYSNRIEIKNPGYSLIPDERLGDPGSKTRNPMIAATLHDARLAETKGTGIRVMREIMNTVNLTSPLIESDRFKDEFTLTLLVHHLLGEDDLRWLARFKDCDLSDDDARALVILREIAILDNATYRSVNKVDALTASGRLRRLRDLGLLEQHGSAASTHYSAGPRFFEATKSPKSKQSRDALRRELPDALRRELDALRRELPEHLSNNLDSLGKRISPETLNETIVDLCNWKPLSLNELSLLLAKNPTHLQTRNIKRLLTDGRLVYLFPDEINHPRQKYVTAEFE